MTSLCSARQNSLDPTEGWPLWFRPCGSIISFVDSITWPAICLVIHLVRI